MNKNNNEKLKYARFKLFWEAKRLKDVGYSQEDFLYYAENMPEDHFSLEAQIALDYLDIDLKHIASVIWTFNK